MVSKAAIILLVYVVGNALGYFLATLDKHAARAGARRQPESTFILLAVLGFWPGQVLAFKVHRHKTKKRTFQMRFIPAAMAGTFVWIFIAFLVFVP